MKRPIWLTAAGIGAAAAAAAVIAVLWTAPELNPGQAGPDAEVVAVGRSLYQTHCASCHGVDGLSETPASSASDPNGSELEA